MPSTAPVSASAIITNSAPSTIAPKAAPTAHPLNATLRRSAQCGRGSDRPNWRTKVGGVSVVEAAAFAALLNPPLTPAPIPSAFGPHIVERAWFMASRWSAPLYERPGRHGPRLLGSAWVEGGRDGSPRRSPRSGRHSRRVPRPSRSLSAPAGGMSCAFRFPSSRLSRSSCATGVAGAQSGAETGAQGPGGEPGSARRAERGALMK
jgi:hypothetical protein